MSAIYLIGNKEKLCIENNCFCIKEEDVVKRRFPIETIEYIQVIGNAQITTACVKSCMERGIRIAYYTEYGRLCGIVQPMNHIHIDLERKQAIIGESEFSNIFGRNILSAKIHNQWVYLNRMAKKRKIDISFELKQIKNSENKIVLAQDISSMMGYEGIAAKYYFQGLSKLLPEKFQFEKRNKRPPKDPFNAMISYGYAIVAGEIHGKLLEKGLNPYFGFIHKDKNHHAALVSDLLEEWRTVIVDSMVYSLINEKKISILDFEMQGEGVYIKTEGKRVFLNQFEKKMCMETKYLQKYDFLVDFRKAIGFQISSLIKAIEIKQADYYQPIRIR